MYGERWTKAKRLKVGEEMFTLIESGEIYKNVAIQYRCSIRTVRNRIKFYLEEEQKK